MTVRHLARIAAIMALSCACVSAAPSLIAQPEGDDFNDNQKDATKWGADTHYPPAGNGRLVEGSQRLEWREPTSPASDEVDRRWIRSNAPFSSDWEVRIDLYNDTVPATDNAVNSFGIYVNDASDSNRNFFFLELYASSLGGPPARRGFAAGLYGADSLKGSADSGPLDVTHGAIRISFSSGTKVLSAWYDTDVSDGYQWAPLGTFGLGGSGGANGNGSWGMAETDPMTLDVYGFASNMPIASGRVWGDNFQITGGVPPSADSVLLVSPNGGEVLSPGELVNIDWTAPTSMASFRLEQTTNGGETWSLIASNVSGTLYGWTVPHVKGNSPRCRLRIKAYDAAQKLVGKDISDGTFTIEVIRILSPNGAETLTSGSPATITWSTAETIKQVSSAIVKFSKNAGATWTKIATVSGNPGAYDWTVPTVTAAKAKCKVKVVLKAGDGSSVGSDLSDATFTIAP